MDVYTATRLYKKVLVHWWEEASEDQKENVTISLADIPIESLFILLFRTYPITKSLLIASDGQIQVMNHMDDPTPATFRLKRFMKIDNKTSISSVKNVIQVLYQLLSISVENSAISILDWIGLIQFFILLHTEQFINVATCELFLYFQRNLFIRNESIKGIEETTWKTLRNRVLTEFYESTSKQATECRHETLYYLMYESLLTRMNTVYPLLQKLSDTIDLQQQHLNEMEERMLTLVTLLNQGRDEVQP